MSREPTTRQPLEITNPNSGRVVEQLNDLLNQWRAWLVEAKELPDSPDYDPQTCAEVIKDGWDNIHKHERIREKTLVFLSNNFAGYEFLLSNWPNHPHESNLDRKRKVIPTWIHRLETLADCVEYAKVPDGYWKARGKQVVEAIAGKGPEKAADIIATVLKGG